MIVATSPYAAVEENPVEDAEALVVAGVVDEEREVNRIGLACCGNEAEQLFAADEHPLVGLQFGRVHVGINYIIGGSVSVIAAAEAEILLAARLEDCAVVASCVGCAEGLSVLGNVIDKLLALNRNEFPSAAQTNINIAVPAQEVHFAVVAIRTEGLDVICTF